VIHPARRHADYAIIDALGGTGAVAEILGIQPPSVSEWRVSGIPPARKQTLGLLFPDQTPPEWRPRAPGLQPQTPAAHAA
jgi:hypothetical protein